jgi:hypothetical protein
MKAKPDVMVSDIQEASMASGALGWNCEIYVETGMSEQGWQDSPV